MPTGKLFNFILYFSPKLRTFFYTTTGIGAGTTLIYERHVIKNQPLCLFPLPSTFHFSLILFFVSSQPLAHSFTHSLTHSLSSYPHLFFFYFKNFFFFVIFAQLCKFLSHLSLSCGCFFIFQSKKKKKMKKA